MYVCMYVCMYVLIVWRCHGENGKIYASFAEYRSLL